MDKPIGNKAAFATEEELHLIKEFILLPILLTIVQNNLDKVKYDPSPLKPLFEQSTEILMDIIHTDLVKVKKELNARKIKVVELQASGGHSIVYDYYCRGYKQQFTMLRTVVKSEMSIKLGYYTEQFSKKFSR